VPYVTTWLGFVAYAAVMLVFAVQEFSQGFGTPDDANGHDDRWALVYLDALPVTLVALSIGVSVLGWTAWGSSRAVFVVGFVVLVAGIVVRQWSHRTLGRFHQAVVTVHDDHRIVTDGPYRFVRHPMYAGSAVAFLGTGLALGTWIGLALTFLGTLPAMLRRIHVEERALNNGLGERYKEYAAGRSRLLPGIW